MTVRAHDGNPGLEARQVSKRFQGVHALRDVNLTVRPGEVVGIVGPNGAGKSTLLGALTGFVPIDSGEIWCAGERIDGRKPDAIAAAGLVVRTFQSTRVLELPGRDNVVVGTHRFGWRSVLGSLFAPWRRGECREEGALEDRARVAWETLGLPDPADLDLDDADAGTLRLLQICRAVAADPRVLLLDEPTAGLDRKAAEAVCGAVRSLRERGTGVALVEQDLGIVRRVCDRVVVLAAGEIIADGSPEQVAADPATASVYAGQEAAWI
jgi:ABC-type branched-subunit amino acid transport system ATPase component